MASIDEDPFAAFSEELEELRSKVGDLEQKLGRTTSEMRGSFQALAAAKSGGEEGLTEDSENERPWWFPTMSAQEAQSAWDTLLAWLDEVRARIPKLDKHLGRCPCWYRHPDAVDRLAALYVVWDNAYTGDSLGSARAEYLERWGRATLQALEEINGSCVSSCELLDPPSPLEDLSLEEFIEADIGGRTAVEG